jgi:CO/xanthine dehydrogenase Mo-binding subunit
MRIAARRPSGQQGWLRRSAAGQHFRPADRAATFITVGAPRDGGDCSHDARRSPRGADADARRRPVRVGFPSEYIQIDPDDGVLIWSAQPEMGEGTKTSLAMIVADELDADWTRVRVDDAPMDPKYGGQGVGGSDAIRSDWDNLRRVGATARPSLIDAAARMGVPAQNATPASTSCVIPPANASSVRRAGGARGDDDGARGRSAEGSVAVTG